MSIPLKGLLVVLPREGVERIESQQGAVGDLQFRYSAPEQTLTVRAITVDSGAGLPIGTGIYSALRRGDSGASGQWLRVSNEQSVEHWMLSRRPRDVYPWEDFRRAYPHVRDPGANVGLAITHNPNLPLELLQANVPTFAAWYVSRAGVFPAPLTAEPAVVGTRQLEGHWPVEHLGGKRVLIVGTGSIGGSAATKLSAYGVGTIGLMDPDRLLWHNVVRHVLGPESVGRYKVNALADVLKSHRPQLEVEKHVIDVVDDADRARPIFDEADLIVCAADGVGPRRVVSHLARRSGKVAVLACVLDNGSVGEVLRLLPGRNSGCLLCQREHLRIAGGIDPEVDQEAAYGTGHTHRPMTAVGADLDFIGSLAAKIAVATLLQANGDHGQRLEGEQAIVALRPKPGLASPYDVAPVGRVEWHPGVKPRPGCPTCGSQ